MDKKEWFQFYNSLVCLAKGLENTSTVIDLRNEVSVSGRIVYVDGHMNVTLENATYYEFDKPSKQFETLFIPARNIRNFVIPENISVKNIINNQLERKPNLQKVEKKRTLKISRALKNQKETKQLVETILKEKRKTEK